MGFAHPVLPCGAKIYLGHGGILTQVVARGAIPGGVQFGLTDALAEELGIDAGRRSAGGSHAAVLYSETCSTLYVVSRTNVNQQTREGSSVRAGPQKPVRLGTHLASPGSHCARHHRQGGALLSDGPAEAGPSHFSATVAR